MKSIDEEVDFCTVELNDDGSAICGKPAVATINQGYNGLCREHLTGERRDRLVKDGFPVHLIDDPLAYLENL